MPAYSNYPKREVSTNTRDGSPAGSYHIGSWPGVTHMSEHLPYAPANGFNLQNPQFDEGQSWTAAPGSVQLHSGKVDI